MLRLVDGATANARTLVKDWRAASFADRERSQLRREPWLIRGGFGRTFYASIVGRDGVSVRFDPACMSQPSGTRLHGDVLFTERLLEVPARAIQWQPGLTAVIDNRRMVHAREASGGDELSRALDRVLVQ